MKNFFGITFFFSVYLLFLMSFIIYHHQYVVSNSADSKVSKEDHSKVSSELLKNISKELKQVQSELKDQISKLPKCETKNELKENQMDLKSHLHKVIEILFEQIKERQLNYL